jgi:hypothetical protein
LEDTAQGPWVSQNKGEPGRRDLRRPLVAIPQTHRKVAGMIIPQEKLENIKRLRDSLIANLYLKSHLPTSSILILEQHHEPVAPRQGVKNCNFSLLDGQ